jgi:hypothetical protein
MQFARSLHVFRNSFVRVICELIEVFRDKVLNILALFRFEKFEYQRIFLRRNFEFVVNREVSVFKSIECFLK